MTRPLDRPHVWLPGGPPLLLLHGTGGDEHDLLPLRGHLAPGGHTIDPHQLPRLARFVRTGQHSRREERR